MTTKAAVIQKFGDADVHKYENIETPKPKPGPPLSQAAEVHRLISTNQVKGNVVLLPWAEKWL